MKPRTIKTFITTTLALLLAAPAAAQSLRWAYIEFPPVFFTDDAGKPAGSLIDIGAKVLDKAGFKWKAESFPTKRMIDCMVRGECDLWIGLATLPPFKDTTLAGKSDLLTITLCSYSIGDKPPIAKKEDLSGKSVIVLRSYSYGGWIHYIKDPANNVRYQEIPDDHETAFKMLAAGRADYLLDYAGPSAGVIEKLAIPDLRNAVLSSFGARMVVSKKTPHAETILQRLEAAYRELKDAGQL